MMKHMVLVLTVLVSTFLCHAQQAQTPSVQQQTSIQNSNTEADWLAAMHTVSSHDLLKYVEILCDKKYGGRLTGTQGYNMAAEYVVSELKRMGVAPAGDNGTYLQAFANPYTLVFPGSYAYIYLPGGKEKRRKTYVYEKDFIPGSTSGTGAVKAEVVFVGYGITAPELEYDDYQGVDVKGKIVLVNPEIPVPQTDSTLFKKWRPYSFHQYKVENAKKHGAAGMLYNYFIANPNCTYIPDLILTYVYKSVVDDIFQGEKESHKEVIDKIKQTLKPASFHTKKIVGIKNVTEHHPEGIGYNVLGIIEGTDPALKNEALVMGSHLDHVGYNYKLCPGATDDASGVSVELGVIQALANLKLKPKRSIVFAFFGAEEQGVKGSEFYVSHRQNYPYTVTAFLTLDGGGRGDKFDILAGKNFPDLWNHFSTANTKYIHRIAETSFFANLGRQRLDGAHFMWAGIPMIGMGTDGLPLEYDTYHKTTDDVSTITPEIMEDQVQMIFMGLSTLVY